MISQPLSKLELESKLGQVERTFEPSGGNVAAGAIFGIAFMVGGLALIGWPIRQLVRYHGHYPISTASIMIAIGIGLIIFGLVIFRWVRTLNSFRVYVCEHGFYCESDSNQQVFPWDEIAAIHETVLHEKLPIVKGPAKLAMPSVTNVSYTVVSKTGDELELHGTIVGDIQALGEILNDASQSRGITWTSEEEYG